MRARTSVLVFLVFCSVGVSAAEVISTTVLPCGKVGIVGGLGAGTDLRRFTVDTARFPNARCNDGTPAIFYYGAATREEDRGKWILFLQGGGSCNSGQSCAERWCSIDSNYGMDKMSSSLSKEQIRGVGFLSPEERNRFRTWNRVLIYYCSSDQWGGSKFNTLTTPKPGGGTLDYQIYFRGSEIVESVIDTLRNAAAPSSRRRAVGHGSSETPSSAMATSEAWPDLDSATHVIFAGSSGGGGGVNNNADRVGAKLRATNPNLVDYRVVIDAATSPDTSDNDYTITTYCQKDSTGCSYAAFMREAYEEIDVSVLNNRGDESCVTWHASREAGSEWICRDRVHVLWNHITSPFFTHQDLIDPNVGREFVESGLGDQNGFALEVDDLVRTPPVPEEARGAIPGAFTLQCGTHEAFTTNADVFDIRVNGTTYNEALWNWWSGSQPQRVLATYTGTPVKVAGCPAD